MTIRSIDVTVVVDYGVSIVEVGNAIRSNVIEQVGSRRLIGTQ